MNVPNVNDPYQIATMVLAKASQIDPKMAFRDDATPNDVEMKIQAWAGVIAQGLFPRLHECLAAVDKHYATSDFAIMPRAIVEYLDTVGVDSSPERLMDWALDHARRYPRSLQVGALSGLEQPSWDELSREEASDRYVAWVLENQDEITRRLVGHLAERLTEAQNRLAQVYDPYQESQNPDLEALE